MSVFAILIKKPPEPTGAWVDYTSNTYWSPALAATWDTDKWYMLYGTECQLNAIGSWADGFRPTKMRVTFTGVNESFILYGTTGIIDTDLVTLETGVEFNLTFGSFDIDRIYMKNTVYQYYITKIEFWDPNA